MMVKSGLASVSLDGSWLPGNDRRTPSSSWEPQGVPVMMGKTPAPLGSPGVFHSVMQNLMRVTLTAMGT